MGDIDARDPDVAQHALVEADKVQAIPVPPVPDGKRVHHGADKGIDCVHETGKPVR